MTDDLSWNVARLAIGVIVGFLVGCVGCVGCARHADRRRAVALRNRETIERFNDDLAGLDGWRVDIDMQGNQVIYTKVERWADAYEVHE